MSIKEITNYAEKIASGQEDVKPGTPTRFTEASTPFDRIWQGDLALTIKCKIPDNYVEAEKPLKNLQLVHGSNVGSMHCLDAFDGVRMYVPKNWNAESLEGPYLILEKERTVTHPKHGNVTIPAGFSVHCTYQREYDKELAKERRARD